jgi:hypothetical protein
VSNGYETLMTSDDATDLSDGLVPTESVHPDHHEHAKESKHLDDEELASRAEHERKIVNANRETKQQH